MPGYPSPPKVSGAAVLLCVTLLSAQPKDGAEFFEAKVRPILINRCGSCHGDKTQMGGKQLTSKDGMHRAGVVMAGNPDESPLIKAIRYDGKMKMPPTGKCRKGKLALWNGG